MKKLFIIIALALLTGTAVRAQRLSSLGDIVWDYSTHYRVHFNRSYTEATGKDYAAVFGKLSKEDADRALYVVYRSLGGGKGELVPMFFSAGLPNSLSAAAVGLSDAQVKDLLFRRTPLYASTDYAPQEKKDALPTLPKNLGPVYRDGKVSDAGGADIWSQKLTVLSPFFLKQALVIRPGKSYAFSRAFTYKVLAGTTAMEIGAEMTKGDVEFSKLSPESQAEYYRNLREVQDYYAKYGTPSFNSCLLVQNDLNQTGTISAATTSALERGFYGIIALKDGKPSTGIQLAVVAKETPANEGSKDATTPEKKPATEKDTPKTGKEQPGGKPQKSVVEQEQTTVPGQGGSTSVNVNVYLIDQRAEKETANTSPQTRTDTTAKPASPPEQRPQFAILLSGGVVLPNDWDDNAYTPVGGIGFVAFLSDSAKILRNLGIGGKFIHGGFKADRSWTTPTIGSFAARNEVERDGSFSGWRAGLYFRPSRSDRFSFGLLYGQDRYTAKETVWEIITTESGVPTKTKLRMPSDNIARKCNAIGLDLHLNPSKKVSLGLGLEWMNSPIGWSYAGFADPMGQAGYDFKAARNAFSFQKAMLSVGYRF